MKTWQSVLFGSLLGVFLGVILCAGIYLSSRQPQGRSVELLSAPTLMPLVVQVAGEVRTPGLYTLPRGSRVQDAVAAAGGLNPGANSLSVNLAARIKDGEKLVVAAADSKDLGAVPAENPGSQATQAILFPINLNTATLEELDALPGIGPSRAQDILGYREEHGEFKSIEELNEVHGIGEGIFNQLKDLVFVGPEY
jgi:competence protein ComEA